MVHENTAHHARGNRQEMCTVPPWDVLGIDEPQICFVDQRCGLKAVPGTLPCHATPCDLVQVPLHERNQPVEGALVALAPS